MTVCLDHASIAKQQYKIKTSPLSLTIGAALKCHYDNNIHMLQLFALTMKTKL